MPRAKKPKAPPEPPMRAYLLEMAQALPLFLSQDNKPYIDCPTTVPLYSENFYGWILRTAKQHFNQYPTPYDTAYVTRMLDQQARQQRNKRQIHTRIAKLAPKTYQLDLATKDGEVINITSKGWDYAARPKVCFERLGSQVPFLTADPCGISINLKTAVVRREQG